MEIESIHACDCANGYTYVGTISVQKVLGHGSAPTRDELALSHYFVIPTKTLIDRTWTKEVGEDHKEYLKYIPYSQVVSALYCRLRDQGSLNKRQVRLPVVNANHELDV